MTARRRLRRTALALPLTETTSQKTMRPFFSCRMIKAPVSSLVTTGPLPALTAMAYNAPMSEDDEYDEMDRRYSDPPPWVRSFDSRQAILIFALALSSFAVENARKPHQFEGGMIEGVIFALTLAIIAGFLGPKFTRWQARRRAKRQGGRPLDPDHGPLP